MAHIDKGNYAGKQPDGTSCSAQAADAVRSKIVNGDIACAAAHRIALDLSLSPAAVGRAIDQLEVRIVQCQLGIFKHSAAPPGSPPDVAVTPEKKQAIEAALVNGRLTCAAAWRLADQFGLTRRQVARACDMLGVKISACQLGTFE